MCAQNEPVTYLWISHETWRYVSHGSNDGWYFNLWKEKERFVLLISHFFGEKFWKISDFFLDEGNDFPRKVDTFSNNTF